MPSANVSWGALVLHVASHLPVGRLASLHRCLRAEFQDKEIRDFKTSESLALELTKVHLGHILLKKASHYTSPCSKG